jgi:hypothetical protein
MADSTILPDVLTYLRTRFISRSITIGLWLNNKAGPWLSDYQEPAIDRMSSRTLDKIRQAGAVPMTCIPAAKFVSFLESRGHDPIEIINELMAKKLVTDLLLDLSPTGEPGPIPAEAVIPLRDLATHPDFLTGPHRLIGVHADIMDIRPTPGTSGRGQPEGAGAGSQGDDRQAVEDEANGVISLPRRARDILRVMLREGITSPGTAWSQDNIAGEVRRGFNRDSLKNPFATLRKRGLISSTYQGPESGTYLTAAGIAAAERLAAPKGGK